MLSVLPACTDVSIEPTLIKLSTLVVLVYQHWFDVCLFQYVSHWCLALAEL